MIGRWTIAPVSYRNSSIHGYGAFAEAPIAAGEIVSTLAGAWFRKSMNDAPTPRWRFWLSKYAYRDALATIFLRGPMKFVNHGCDPNIFWRDNDMCIALRDIASGEELVEDYGVFIGSGTRWQCRCGSPACKGIVRRNPSTPLVKVLR